jgi:hypothetical protein
LSFSNLSSALTKQFLPARAALLADYWQKTVDKTVEKWRFAEVDYSSAFNNFGIAITRGCACSSITRITPRRD